MTHIGKSVMTAWLFSLCFISALAGNRVEEGVADSQMSFCPFFTLVADASPPTCNGSDDGVAAVLEPTDGVGPYTYQWIGGPMTREWVGVGAGTYTVIVFDVGQGTACNMDVFVNEPGPLTLFALNGIPPSCAGECDGQATPLIIGGNGGYELTWSSGETGPSPTALCATFTLHVEDVKGCLFDTTVTFTNTPDPIDIDPDVVHVACHGDDDGSIDVTLTGGTQPYNVQWTGPNGFSSTFTSLSGLEPGAYTIEVVDAHGCTESSTITIQENPELLGTADVVDNDCFGENEGSIDLHISGGVTPYSVSWAGPNGFSSTDEDLSGLEAGNYVATIIDAANCIFVVAAEVEEPTEITVDLTGNDLLCHSDFSGSATAEANGGSSPYVYAWTGPDGYTGSGSDISGLAAGTYEVQVTDALGCAVTGTIVLQEPNALSAQIAVTEITCHNATDGAITITPEEGTAPYTVDWTGPGSFTSNSETISGLLAGTYHATVEDANGCEYQTSVVLANPTTMQITSSILHPSCNTGATGAITINVTNGAEPYDYDWTGPNGFTSSAQNPTNLGGGTYNLTVTDANGCQISQSFSVVAPDAITATFDVTNVTCRGGSDGEILITTMGGTPPYEYMWVGPAGFISTEENMIDVPAGGYNVMITDANGCATFLSVTVGQPANTTIGANLTQPSCFGANDGAIALTVGGGTPPFSFAWTGPGGYTASTKNILNLGAGHYSLVITDAAGCTITREYDLNQPGELIVDGTISHVTCHGSSDGSVVVDITGGTPGYLYQWTGPNGFSTTSKDIHNVPFGTYTFELTDINGCQVSETFVITQPNPLTAASDVHHISCFGAGDGSISLDLSGGTQPWMTQWTGPNGYTSSSEDISLLEAGTYTAIITDANGCETTVTHEISEPQEVLITSLTFTDITCHGQGDGTAEVTAEGGTAPLEYNWTGPGGFSSASQTLTGLQEGIYGLTVTDANGCSKDTSFTVNEPDLLWANLTSTNPDCLIDNGTIEAEVHGGTIAVDYVYEWVDSGGNTVSTTAVATDLSPGVYTFTVTDDNGCTYTESRTLTRKTFNISAFVVSATCPGGEDGTIQVLPSNGVSPYTFDWTGPNGFTGSTAQIENLGAGAYQVVIQDATGCTQTFTYDVSEPDPIVFNPTVNDESCVESGDGSITLAPQGGQAPYEVAWSSTEGFSATGLSVSQLLPGDYLAEITDQNGCVSDTLITIAPATALTVDFTSVNPECHGDFSGEITAEGSGGTPGFTYQWAGSNGFSATGSTITGLEAGVYSLILTDSKNCLITETVEITQPDPFDILLVTESSHCLQSDGEAYAEVTGGNGDYSFSWSDADGNHITDDDTLQNVPSGLYVLTVTDVLGCSATTWVTITDIGGDIEGQITEVSCFGGSDGAITITVSGGTEPFAYEWSDTSGVISTDAGISDIPAGNYAVLVSDANGCLFSENFAVGEADELTADITVGEVSCMGEDGTIEVEVEGGVEPYQISWTGPDGFSSTSFELSGLSEGDYEYELTDANGCTSQGTVHMDVLPEIEVITDASDVLCTGGTDGELSISVSGGLEPLQIEWTGPNGFSSSELLLTDLGAGTYELTVTDAAGCTFEDEYEISEPSPFDAEFTVSTPGCNLEDGEIQVEITGGEAGDTYTFEWIDDLGVNVGNDQDLIGVGAGTYTLTVENQNGCAETWEVSLSNPVGDVVSTVVHEHCYDSHDGEITLEITDVAEPFTVFWSGPGGFTSNDQNIDGLTAGTYEYSIVGADGCATVGEAIVESPSPITTAFETTGVCAGESTGSIATEIEGGEAPYTIQWSGPDGFVSQDENLSELAAGTYTATVEDAIGCVATFTAEVEESPEMVLTADVDNLSCFGEADGGISIDVTGGIPPFHVEWEGPEGFAEEGETIENLSAGTYTAVVTDALQCTATLTVEVEEPEEILVEVVYESPGCSEENDSGTIMLFPSQGSGGFFVSWTGPDGFTSQDFDLFGLEAGTYHFTVSDEAGCAVQDSVVLNDVVPMEVFTEMIPTTCFDSNDGGITASITGGMAPRVYSWTGPDGFTSADSILTGLTPGTYVLTVEDSAGCSLTAEVEVTAPDELVATIGTWIDASCEHSTDGSITAVPQGGTEPYQHIWTDGEGTLVAESATVENLAPGHYHYVVVDANGCSDTTDFTLGYLFEMEADSGDDFSLCEGDMPLTVSGASSTADAFFWILGVDTVSHNADLIIDELGPGDYVFVLTAHDELCSATDTLTVTILESPDVDAGPDLQVFMEENFVLGGTPTSQTANQYLWNPPALGGFDVQASNPSGHLLASTWFVVTVTDANGCSAGDSVFVEVLPDISITSGFTPNNDGVNDTWIIDHIEQFPNSTVHVFNRWGEPVFSARGYRAAEAWDGTHNGKDVPSGTYYYAIELNDPRFPEPFTGPLTIHR